MTHTQTVLRCDGCRIAFPPIAESRNSDRAEQAIRALRDRATKAGWRRYRPTPVAPIGDFCPHCREAHANRPPSKRPQPRRPTADPKP